MSTRAARRVFLPLVALCLLLGDGPHPAEGQTPETTLRTRSQVQPEPYVNLSELHFARSGRAAEILEEGLLAPAEARSASPITQRERQLRLTRVTTWNSEAGRSALADRLALGALQGDLRSLGLEDRGLQSLRSIAWEGGRICTEPTVIKADSECCSYWIKDEVGGKDVRYRQPYHAFPHSDPKVAEQLARDFVGSVRASMPMFLPYKSKNVRAGHGWIYDNANHTFHGAVDYGKDSYPAGEDPSFRVYSIAAGTVLAAYWDDWFGNTVVIEHGAPNGDRYRSVYMHLRNGLDHDLAKAKAIPTDKEYKDGKITHYLRYKRYAQKPNPSQLQWGTNAQKIAIKAGDKVSAGQFIAFSGNTGAGGAGNGLTDDGTPKNDNSANNHLHLMVAVPNPTPGSTEWVQVDPYGVYSRVGSGCYDLLDDTPYVRLFAPFYPSFHNVPVAVLAKYFGYYPGMGMALQTLNLHRQGSKVLASGSFQAGLSPEWYARFYMTGAEYQHWFDEYHKKGFRPREISVTRDGSANPRFTVLWKKRGNESYASFHGLSDAQWKAKWEELVVNGKMRVEDRVGYSVGGTNHHAAIFVGDGNSAFYEWHYLSGSAFQTKFDEYHQSGFRLWSMDVAELDAGLSFGGVWQKVPGAWLARYGLTPAQYQAAFEEYSGQGYRLHRLRGYFDSGRFAAIWTKP